MRVLHVGLLKVCDAEALVFRVTRFPTAKLINRQEPHEIVFIGGCYEQPVSVWEEAPLAPG